MQIAFRLIILLLLFVPVISSRAELIQTLSLQFERELLEGEAKEITHGTIYYDASPQKVVVEVTDPISQIMVVKDKVLEIYYPIEGKAFRFKSKGMIPLPFIETIRRVTKTDGGLTDVGYSLLRHEQKEDTLYTYWGAPSKMKKVLGIAILGSIEDRIVSFEMQTPDGDIAAKSLYQKHIKLANRYIPMEISSEIYDQSGVMQHEHVSYSNAQLNMELPDWVVKFRIPMSVKVKEVGW